MPHRRKNSSFISVCSEWLHLLVIGGCLRFVWELTFRFIGAHQKRKHTGSSACNNYQIVWSILVLCRLNTNHLPYVLIISSEKMSNALLLTKWKTYVVPTTALLYNLCALSLIKPLHTSALLPRHFQGADTIIYLKCRAIN